MKLGNPEEVGRMMRERRKTMGFTIEQMAQAVGLSPITIMRIELGRVGYVHAKTAQALEVPKKIEKRMVMVATPVDDRGNVLARPTQATLVSGDSQIIKPGQIVRPEPHVSQNIASRAKPRAKKRVVELAGKAHTMSPLKKMFLWMAKHS